MARGSTRDKEFLVLVGPSGCGKTHETFRVAVDPQRLHFFDLHTEAAL